MQLLGESTVGAEEIDSLGHMNVRYYMARMEKANRILIDQLSEEATSEAGDVLLRRTDTYTRFRREQFRDATLHTVGGVLALNEGGMASYVEIRNPDRDEVAATFIVTTARIDRSSRTILPFAPATDAAATLQYIDIPRYARPRSLDMGPVKTDITLAELEACIPEIEGGGMMSGRRNTLVEDADVDSEGWLREDTELMFLPFAKLAQEQQTTQGPPVFNTAEGLRVGWAVIETRTLQYAQPRLGDRLAYFSADLRLEQKSRLSRRWAYNTDTGQMLGISDTVGVCIDLDARRAIDWPDELRDTIQQHLQPQLA